MSGIHLLDLLQLYTPSWQFCSSADTQVFRMPSCHTKSSGQRSFSHLSRLQLPGTTTCSTMLPPSVPSNLPSTLSTSLGFSSITLCVYVSASVCMPLHLCVCLCICVYVSASVCMPLHLCVSLNIHVCVHVLV